MLNRIKKLLNPSPGDKSGARPHSHEDKQIAAAALLIEAARMDDDFTDDERAAITRLLEKRFGLDAETTASLIEHAEKIQDESRQLIRFTRAIKDNFSEAERVELIEMMWEVVYADGELHHYEANLLRRIGGLIYVSERDRGDARKRVVARLGLDQGTTGGQTGSCR